MTVYLQLRVLKILLSYLSQKEDNYYIYITEKQRQS